VKAGGLVADSLVSSRLGFRGTEDLGGGLTAKFELEGTLNPATGNLGLATGGTNASATTFNRGAWAGLASTTYGEVRVGRQDVTNMSNFTAAVITTAGNMAKSPITYLTADKDQAINYISPTYAGFQLQVGHAMKNAVTATTATEATTDSSSAYAVQYSAGKLTAVAGKASQKAIVQSDDLEEANYGVKYDFGFAEVAAAYHTQDKNGGSAKKTGKTFSAAAPVAALGSGVKLHAVYVSLNDAAAATNNYDSYRFAATKAFSKRTTGYAAYTSTTLGSGTTTQPTSLLFGMVHTF